VYPAASQLVRVEMGRREGLFADLDKVAGLTREGRIGASFHRAARSVLGVLGLVEAELVTGPGPVWEMGLKGRASQACMSRIRPLSGPVRQAKSLIEAGFAGRAALGELAGQVHMSQAQLRRAFTAQMGKTPRAYRDSLRVQAMARLLLGSASTVAQIAHQVGWADEHRAIEVFRDAADITPGAYRDRFGSARRDRDGDGAEITPGRAEMIMFGV
jgi:AraC-like DNA-binding protein